jgi:hypothetical protein
MRSRFHADRIARVVSSPSATLVAATATFPSAIPGRHYCIPDRDDRPTSQLN